MKLTGELQIFAHDAHTISSTQEHELGIKARTADGRIYRYAKAGSTALAAGKITIAADVVGNHEDIAVNTFAIDDKEVTVTLGATLATENQYAGGYCIITDDTGEGIAYLISGHLAADASADLILTLDEPIKVAAVANTTVTLVANPYNAVIVSDGTISDVATGVPNVAVTASYYFWSQTGGVCTTLVDETTVPVGGQPVVIGDVTAGGVEVINAATEPIVGVALKGFTYVETEYHPILLTLDS